jgi:hypothetical protein
VIRAGACAAVGHERGAQLAAHGLAIGIHRRARQCGDRDAERVREQRVAFDFARRRIVRRRHGDGRLRARALDRRRLWRPRGGTCSEEDPAATHDLMLA